MPKISVIVPIYNVEKYLNKCLDSLINQTLTDIEIICIDDCSTDGSSKILQKYALSDPRIIFIKHKKNSGLSAARNTGLKLAKAKYIMFCDSDDWFELNMCEHMFNLITKNKADLGICSANVVSESDKIKPTKDKRFILPNGIFYPNDEQLKNKSVAVWLRIILRDIIKKKDIIFPEGLKYEDTYFSNIYNLYTTKIATTSEKLYNYRIRNGSIMNLTQNGETNSALDFVKIALQYFNYLKKHDLYIQEYNTFWTQYFVSCAQGALMYTKNKIYMRELDELLIDFIKKNYIFGTTNPRTDYIISLILNKSFMRRKKYLFGIIQIFQEKIKTEYCVWKIPIFKIKHLDTKIKYYLFGICIYKKDRK